METVSAQGVGTTRQGLPVPARPSARASASSVVRVARDRRAPAPVCPLSRQELALVACAASGLSNISIARSYGLSVQTVKNHFSHLLQKLRVRDRTSAVVLALQHGWIDLDQIQVESRDPVHRAA